MTIDDEILQHARELTERVIASRFADDDAQSAEVLNALWSSNAFIADMKAMGRVSNEADVAVRLNQLLKDRPDLSAATPSSVDVGNFLLEKLLAVHGQESRGELRLLAHRQAAAMTPAQRRESGAKASEKKASDQKPVSNDGREYHHWETSDPRFNAEIKRRWGKDSWEILGSEKQRYISALQASSRDAGKERASETVGLINHAESVRTLSPEERITRFRAAQAAGK